jgi:hypothetical protein
MSAFTGICTTYLIIVVTLHSDAIREPDELCQFQTLNGCWINAKQVM